MADFLNIFQNIICTFAFRNIDTFIFIRKQKAKSMNTLLYNIDRRKKYDYS